MTGVVLITGAAGDLGAAVARDLAAHGYRLALGDADVPAARERLGETAAECRALGADVFLTPFDVTQPDAVEAAVQRCVKEFGPPSGLYNNAGAQGAFTTIERYPIDDLRKVFEVNVFGLWNVLASVARAMIDAGVAGSIVNTASMAGVGGAPNMAAYSGTKAAVIGITKSAAKDLAPHGIRVNAVSPAFIGPGMMWDRQVALQAEANSQYYSNDPAVVAEQMINMVPLRRFGNPSEVASAVRFLLSQDSSYVNGVNMEISGGSA
jgi:NAD(P)-dependent dehydrogenase (short-subunit alcohol dehydrogenase family)